MYSKYIPRYFLVFILYKQINLKGATKSISILLSLRIFDVMKAEQDNEIMCRKDDVFNRSTVLWTHN